MLRALAELPNHAQRALQFARSTPGIGTALVGLSTPAHLQDALAVAARPPIAEADYLRLYERAELTVPARGRSAPARGELGVFPFR